MSDSSVLKRYFDPQGGKLPPNTAEPEEMLEVTGVFGLLRGSRDRALMLEFRKKSGDIRAVSYAYLEHADFNPSEGITLRFGGQQVRIRGRNLNAEIRPNVRLFQSIVRHRISWIQEADQATILESGPQAVVVESIEWSMPEKLRTV